MAYHSIYFTCKDNMTIPEEHRRSLNEFVDAIEFDGKLMIDRTTISFLCNGWCWLYEEDIEYLIEENKLTLGMIEVYRWLKENTEVSSDSWNVCDEDYGPHSWDDIEWDLCWIKDRIKAVEIQLQKTQTDTGG